MKTTLLPAFRLLLVMTIMTGILYPLVMTLLSLATFPYQASGSLIQKNDVVIGSELIGQKFVSDRYFHSRPSAIGYQPLPSGATNWGPTDKRMADSVAARRDQFIVQNHLLAGTEVPKEMLFASGSGVDPHISPEAATLQINRIAHHRGFDEQRTTAVYALVLQFTEQQQFSLFGNPRVNVLKLNLALEEMSLH